jgi:hypothetical protein
MCRRRMGRGLILLRRIRIIFGLIDSVGVYGADGTRRVVDRVTPAQVGHIFRGRYSGGRGDCFAIAGTIDPSPLRGKIQMPHRMSTWLRSG